jgi:hypothetical protein
MDVTAVTVSSLVLSAWSAPMLAVVETVVPADAEEEIVYVIVTTIRAGKRLNDPRLHDTV